MLKFFAAFYLRYNLTVFLQSILTDFFAFFLNPLTSYPTGLGAPTFLVENTGSKIVGPRKMTSDPIPEN